MKAGRIKRRMRRVLGHSVGVSLFACTAAVIGVSLVLDVMTPAPDGGESGGASPEDGGSEELGDVRPG